MSGLGVHYPLGEGHALLGRRMPDLGLETRDGRLRTYSLLHHGQALLICFTGGIDIGDWSDRVQQVNARYTGAWQLPVIGDVPAPDAVLVRPDGHVAWIGNSARAGLTEALTTWFGARDERSQAASRSRLPTRMNRSAPTVAGVQTP